MLTQPISDAGLLERFASQRDEAAFGEIVKRHGPQVLKVCRRGLLNEHDVEDVFQSTFFVLAHKAAAVAWTGSVEGWLCTVARRLVMHARASACRRRSRERPIRCLKIAGLEDENSGLPERYHPAYDPREEVERRDIRRVLDAALGQLPEKYRAPVVLCYLEGKTNEEAARQLGWPPGTMSRRLERARSLLRHRLGRVGFMVAFTVCVACAIGRLQQTGSGCPVSKPVVRQAMQALRDPSGTESTVESRLVRAFSDPGGAKPDEQATVFARNALWAAEHLAGQEPARCSERWLFQAAQMRLAALDLGRVTRSGDRTSLLGAARQLDNTCIGCHEIFRR